MKTQVNHPSLVNLVNQLIERIPETKTYIANRQDPTQVTVQSLKVSRFIEVEVVSSWGSELTVIVGGKAFIDLYLDNDGVYLRKPLRSIHIKYMRSLVRRFAVIERVEEVYEEDYPCQY